MLAQISHIQRECQEAEACDESDYFKRQVSRSSPPRPPAPWLPPNGHRSQFSFSHQRSSPVHSGAHVVGLLGGLRDHGIPNGRAKYAVHPPRAALHFQRALQGSLPCLLRTLREARLRAGFLSDSFSRPLQALVLYFLSRQRHRRSRH